MRRWLRDPERVVGPLTKPGSRVLEIGPGYGFFTVPLLRAVGPEGRVYCVDLQPKMLAGLRRRLDRAHLLDRAELRLASERDLGVSDLGGTVDLTVLLYVLHEVPDPGRLIAQVVATLAPGGRVLLLEPKGHCPAELFARQTTLFREAGLISVDLPPGFRARGEHVALFERPTTASS